VVLSLHEQTELAGFFKFRCQSIDDSCREIKLRSHYPAQ
jgi:hypothetical protein